MKNKIINIALLAGLMQTGCTGQLPGSFRLAQQDETFSSQQEVNTKIDLLWVVDNSASMDISQQKLRDGFATFATRYMKPTWDIRVAVITTDTYMAHPAFTGYLGRTIPGTVNYQSPHINGRLATFQNPSWNPSLVNLTTGRFDAGVKFGDLVPLWGPSFGRLLPGLHDGPITALCSEIMPYFLRGVSNCALRDDQNRNTGVANCLNPNTGAGETSTKECVNTIQNDTVRSGKAIISTMPPAGTPGNAVWTQQLINDFMVNVSAGSAGQGSERGLGSIQQLLADNESTATAFFRPGSLRGIIIVSDEEDQTMVLPSPVPGTFKPQNGYQCDQAGLIALNGAPAVTGANGFCCSGAGCSYGQEGTTCPSKTVDGFTYTPSVCARQDLLVPVVDVKNQLDSFFLALDGVTGVTAGTGASVTANYFVSSIVPLTAAAIQTLQAGRVTEDNAVGAIRTVAVDRGDRYIELGTLVGNGSLAMNLADSDYTPILDAIGRAIIEKKSTFTLARAPTGSEDMIVKVIHANGSETAIPAEKYVISGKSLIVTDEDFILSLAATDKISINYQPKTVF